MNVELLPVGLLGTVTPQQVTESEDTCLVTIMYANNEIGFGLPIGEIGAVCKEKGVLFHTDAVLEETIRTAVKDYYDRHGITYDPARFLDCEHRKSCST